MPVAKTESPCVRATATPTEGNVPPGHHGDQAGNPGWNPIRRQSKADLTSSFVAASMLTSTSAASEAARCVLLPRDAVDRAQYRLQTQDHGDGDGDDAGDEPAGRSVARARFGTGLPRTTK